MSIIEKGLREKLRFNVNGNNTIEDLFDFTSEVLATLGGKLFEEVKRFSSDNPFKTNKKTKTQEKTQLSYDVVKYIYDVKVAEEVEKINEVNKKARRQEILAIIAEKEKDLRNEKSIDELRKELESL
jgi:DNA-binding ferritin-like protein